MRRSTATSSLGDAQPHADDVRRRRAPRRRLSVRAQGRADPRWLARARRRYRTARHSSTPCSRSRGCRRVRSLRCARPSRRISTSRSRTAPPRHRPSSKTDAALGSSRSRNAAGTRMPSDDPTLRWVGARLVPALRADAARDRQPARRSRRPPCSSGSERRAEPWRRARVADGSQLLLRRSEGRSVDGSRGTSASRWPPGVVERHRGGVRHVSRPRSASCCGEPRRCGRWATTSRRRSRCSASVPTWNDESQRVTGLEVIPLAELGRPRVDVTLRISGFFRDALPHAIALLDDAVQSRRRTRRARSRQSDPCRRQRRREVVGPAAWRLRLGRASGDRAGLVAHAGRPRRRVSRVVRVRVRPHSPRRSRQRSHASTVRSDRDRSQEPGQPRARHLRLGRLPPRSWRHGRGGAGVDGFGAEGVVRRHRGSGATRVCGRFARRRRGSCAAEC